MIKINGFFDIIDKQPVLCFKLDTKNFDKLKQHIVNNMFFAYRRYAAAYAKVLLTSIGDHLDSNDNQDLIKADIAIEITIPKTDKKMITALDTNQYWYLCCTDNEQSLAFTLDKETQCIVGRAYHKNDNTGQID